MAKHELSMLVIFRGHILDQHEELFEPTPFLLEFSVFEHVKEDAYDFNQHVVELYNYRKNTTFRVLPAPMYQLDTFDQSSSDYPLDVVSSLTTRIAIPHYFEKVFAPVVI